MHRTQNEFINFEEPRSELNLLERLKHDSDNKLLAWATWLANGFKTVQDGLDERLVRFFNLTLAHEPEKRCTDFERLLGLLSPTR
jgi:hypothetical protein